MTSRRNFLTQTVALAATGAAPMAFAGSHQEQKPGLHLSAPLAAMVYTQEKPGMWAKKVDGHLPEIEIKGNQVTVITNHGMSSLHFIVRHTLILADGTVVGSKTFSPDDEAESVFELPKGYRGKIYATSFCNKHDLWMNEASI